MLQADGSLSVVISHRPETHLMTSSFRKASSETVPPRICTGGLYCTRISTLRSLSACARAQVLLRLEMRQQHGVPSTEHVDL